MIHKAVLVGEVLHYLNCSGNRNYIDCTVGAGGHTEVILEKTSPFGSVTGFEWDLEACHVALERLQGFGGRFRLVKENFKDIGKALFSEKGKYDGILYDLGVSSIHLNKSERGFSFLRDGPLDMRMDKSANLTAEEVVNGFDEDEIADILFRFGEERFSRWISKSIVKERKLRRLSSTSDLAKIIENAIPYRARRKGIHPATKSFMALRIFVNDELDNLKESLESSMLLLKQGARIVVISFHSLEDRLVKMFFREKSLRCKCPKDLPECICNGKPLVKILTAKPVTPKEEEIFGNPRSRSAKLRCVEII